MSNSIRVRIGKTIVCMAKVLIGGEAESLENRNLTVFLVNPRGIWKEITDWTLTGSDTNKVTFTYQGRQQRVLGTYRLVVYENYETDGQSVLDRNIFTLVPYSSMETDALVGSMSDTEIDIDLGSLGFTGPRGYTPYAQDGYWFINGVTTGIRCDYSSEEALRASAEQARVSAEQNRVNAESARVLAEDARVLAEQARVAVEAARVRAEQGRVSAEALRVSAEDARVLAEQARVTAEAARVRAEQGRVTAFENQMAAQQTTFEGKMNDIDTAVATLMACEATLTSLQTEVTEIGAKIDKKVTESAGTNLINEDGLTIGAGISASTTNGNVTQADYTSNMNVSDYIPVKSDGIISNAFFNAYWGGAVYDSNKSFLRVLSSSQYTYQSGDGYIRLTFRATDTPMANYGTTLLPFEEFNPIGGYVGGYVKSSVYETDKASTQTALNGKVSNIELKNTIGRHSTDYTSSESTSQLIFDNLTIKAGDTLYLKVTGTKSGVIAINSNTAYGNHLANNVQLGTIYKVTASEAVTKVYLQTTAACDVHVDMFCAIESEIQTLNEEVHSVSIFSDSSVGTESDNSRLIRTSVKRLVLKGSFDDENKYYIRALRANGTIVIAAVDSSGNHIADVCDTYSTARNNYNVDFDINVPSSDISLDTPPDYYINPACIVHQDVLIGSKYSQTATQVKIFDLLHIKEGERMAVKVKRTSGSSRISLIANGLYNGQYENTYVIFDSNIKPLDEWVEVSVTEDIDYIAIWNDSGYSADVDVRYGTEADVVLAKKEISNHDSRISTLEESDAKEFIESGTLNVVDGNPVIGEVLLKHQSYVDNTIKYCKVAKKAYVCFRCDDNEQAMLGTIGKVASMFEAFGWRYNASINILFADMTTAQYDMLRRMQMHGHELMDHTPNNTTLYVDIKSEWLPLFSPYVGNGIKSIIDHATIADRKVAILDYDINEALGTYTDLQYGGSGAFLAVGGTNTITGDFSTDGSNSNHSGFANTSAYYETGVMYVYIESANGDVPSGWNLIKSKNATTLYLCDVFGNDIKFASDANISVYICMQNLNANYCNVELKRNATYSLLLAGQLWWHELGFEKPRCWVQNGGKHPMANFDDLQEILPKLNMIWAEPSVGKSALTYNYKDYTTNPNACSAWIGYGVLHLDEADLTMLDDAKQAIADNVAQKNIISIASHYKFERAIASTVEGLEAKYLQYLYTLLKFCKDNGIDFITFSERKQILLDAECDDQDNVIPPMYVNMCGRALPDGYTTRASNAATRSQYVTTGGKIESNGCGFSWEWSSSNNDGNIINIPHIGALSKGRNILRFDIKTTSHTNGNIITKINNGTLFNKWENIDTDGNWQTVEYSFDIPKDTEYVSLQIDYYNDVSGIISNVRMFKMQ